VGQVDDLTAPLPGLFKGAKDGTQAYFDYINSLGGVNGRKIKLDAGDSLYSNATVASTTATQIANDFALVGGFSLDDASEAPLIASAKMPDIAYPLDVGLANLPTAYSPFPNGDSDVPTTIFKVLKKKFPTQIKHLGILWANATPSTALAERAFERGAKAEGFKIVYDSSFLPSQTTFLANVLTMKAQGVQMFFSQQLPDSYAATVAKEMQQQNFNPINVESDAYTANLVKNGGSAVNGMYLAMGFVLYLGTDGNLPAVKLFNKWMLEADPTANFELEALFGWASAQLFVDALRNAGSPPTRAGLEAALNKITSFDAGGLLSTGNPSQNIPAPCVVGPSSGCHPHQRRGSSACPIPFCPCRGSSRRSGRLPRELCGDNEVLPMNDQSDVIGLSVRPPARSGSGLEDPGIGRLVSCAIHFIGRVQSAKKRSMASGSETKMSIRRILSSFDMATRTIIRNVWMAFSRCTRKSIKAARWLTPTIQSSHWRTLIVPPVSVMKSRRCWSTASGPSKTPANWCVPGTW
jgi:ABC-type branched-subunit amino acid transport system substrate-binding protein